ncbi:MAG: restriction endonuclease [Candidatus Sumerlaeota bacterium]|nr:restriction endonuclease [Candidatus Sumerlaeota bacterium]
MGRSEPFRSHLKSSADLVTTYEEVRAGFVALALEKNRRATRYVEEARALKTAVAEARTPTGLLQIKGIRPALVAAAGVSDKAGSHISTADKEEAVRGLIEMFLEPAGPSFVEELVFRFLLTRGDALGGSMRNVGGVLAQRRLFRTIVSTLSLAGHRFSWMRPKSGAWEAASGDEAEIELEARGLAWSAGRGSRTLVCNLKVPLVDNNIDLCLLGCPPERLSEACRNPNMYLALAELKGGIDPAGADEHWKTARTALSRVKAAFAEHELTPRVFFVGAAIVRKMADEIWSRLESGAFDNAANLTNSGQMNSLCRWLVRL